MNKLRETIAELQSILASDVKLRARYRRRDRRHPRQVRQRPAHPDRERPGRTRDGGPHRRRGHRHHDDPGGLREVGGRRRVSRAGPRRTRRTGSEAARRGLRRNRSCTRRRTRTSCMFSNRGRVFRLRGHEIPMKERTAKGTAIVNLLNLQPNESIQAIVTTTDFPEDKFLVFATANGTVKKTAFSEYDKSRREGWIAINLREGDEVVRVVATERVRRPDGGHLSRDVDPLQRGRGPRSRSRLDGRARHQTEGRRQGDRAGRGARATRTSSWSPTPGSASG